MPSMIVPCDALRSSRKGVDSLGRDHILLAVSGINAAVNARQETNKTLLMWKKAWYVPKLLVMNSWVRYHDIRCQRDLR